MRRGVFWGIFFWGKTRFNPLATNQCEVVWFNSSIETDRVETRRAVMDIDSCSSGGVLELYERIFGVEAVVDWFAPAFVPNSASIDDRKRWATEMHGFTWTDTTTFKGRSRKRDEEPQPCDCASERPQNAAMMYECLYAAGCTNRQLQDLAQNPRTVPDLEVFDTQGGKGFGVRAMSDLRAGSLICEYVGEALERQHFEKRRGTRSSKSYFLRADDVVIDAARRGNTSRFVNHSCSPSAEVQLWKVPTADGLSVRTAVAIIARHFIKKGSEITYDYRFECFEDALQTRCLCGASDCRRILGKKK